MNAAKVFVDANVLFSACRPGAPLAGIVDDLGERGLLVTSELAFAEAQRNLTDKRPVWLPQLALIRTMVEFVPTGEGPTYVNLPHNDGILLGAAIQAQCAIFLTGDKRHFGALYGQTIEGVLILPPNEFDTGMKISNG